MPQLHTTQPSRVSILRKLAAPSLVLLAAALPLQTLGQTGIERCGDPFKSWFGPWDIRVAPKQAVQNVETHHFTPAVENLVRGVTTHVLNMGIDVDYVLGVFPNHHRALVTMVRLGERDGNDQPRQSRLPIECWFDRAVRFTPDDTIVRLLYANYLGKKGRKEDALVQVRTAEQLAKDNPFTHFNVGMAYFELGEHDKALLAEHKARSLGMRRPELANLLKGANKWSEPQQ